MTQELRRKIRETYRRMMNDYEKTGELYYIYDVLDELKIKFTPIEQNVFHDIRAVGIPFYPQFPVRQFFIDFADPIKKIGIEVDGKKWHLDKNADNQRQNILENDGWKIIRIEGKQTFDDAKSCFENCDYDDEYSVTLANEKYDYCSEGILIQLKNDFYINYFI